RIGTMHLGQLAGKTAEGFELIGKLGHRRQSRAKVEETNKPLPLPRAVDRVHCQRSVWRSAALALATVFADQPRLAPTRPICLRSVGRPSVPSTQRSLA